MYALYVADHYLSRQDDVVASIIARAHGLCNDSLGYLNISHLSHIETRVENITVVQSCLANATSKRHGRALKQQNRLSKRITY